MDMSRAWKYNRGSWEEIDDLLWPFYDNENPNSHEENFLLAGYDYNSNLTLGRWGLSFHVDVHFPTPPFAHVGRPVVKPLYPYYVHIFLVCEYIPVYVVDFPSLLMLLNQVSTIVGQTEELYEIS